MDDADVHVSFEQAVQSLLHMYNTERLALNNQIDAQQETIASYRDQLDQITQEKNEHYESLCSVEHKLKRARAKIILQKEENQQLKNLLTQHGIVIPSKQSLLNTSIMQPTGDASCTPQSSAAAAVLPHSSPGTPGRKSKSLQLRRQRRTPKGDTSGDSLQKSHDSTMESTLNKSTDNNILTQDITFADKPPSPLTTDIFDQENKSTEQPYVQLFQLTPTHPRTSESMLDITDLQGDAWNGSDPSSPSLLSQQRPLVPTPPPSTGSTPASTNGSAAASNISRLTQEVMCVSSDKNSSFLHRKRKGLVKDDLCLPVGGPSITASTPTNNRAVSSGNSLTVEAQSPHAKSMRHDHVIPPTPWHRPVRPSMLSNLLINERREELKSPEDYDEQLSEEILPPGERVVAESLAVDLGGDYEDEKTDEEMEAEDPEITHPFVHTLHTTVGEDADMTRSFVAPASTSTTPKFAHPIPPVSNQTSTSTITSAKDSVTGSSKATTSKTTLTDGQRLALNAGLPSYKCSVVVRRRQDRAKLDAQACPECEAWFRGDDGIHRDKRQHLKQICRHKHLYQPPESDPTFWDISFPDED